MLLIIDGSSVLSSCFYGNLPKEILMAKTEEEKEKYYDKILHSKQGIYTNAIYTMSKILLKIKNEIKPTHIAIAFDQSRDTFRKIMYPQYKAQRGITPKPLKEQFMLMEEILKKSGFITLYSKNVEADDYAGSIAETFKEQIPIRLLTKDHDYMQLVDDKNNIALWLMLNSKEILIKTISLCGDSQENIVKPDRTYECREYEVSRIEGVLPKLIPEKKGICGDSSDNIPGIKGVSDKTAIPLLNHYGSLDNILIECSQNTDNFANQIKELGLKKNPTKAFISNSDIGKLSVDLATIRKNVPVSNNLKDYDINKINWEYFLEELRNLDIQI